MKSLLRYIYINFIAKIRLDFILQVRRRGIVYLLWMSDYTSRKIFISSPLELWDVNYVLKNLGEGDTCIDVGANIGYYTLNLAKAVGPLGLIYSFEPDSRNYLITSLAAKLNGFENVKVVPRVVSDSDGLQFQAVEGIDSTVTYFEKCSEDTDDTTRSMSLDSFLDGSSGSGRKKIRFIKVDTEGAELLVLRGAKKLLSGENAPDFLLIENCDAHLKRFGSSSRQLYSYLMGVGYQKLFYLHDTTSIPIATEVDLEKHSGNFFARKSL